MKKPRPFEVVMHSDKVHETTYTPVDFVTLQGVMPLSPCPWLVQTPILPWQCLLGASMVCLDDSG